MTFTDDLKETILTAKGERAKEEKENRDFDSAWTSLRETLILPIFRKAADLFGTLLRGGEARFGNGSVILDAYWNASRDSFIYWLRFNPDKAKREIVCSSSLDGDQAESFTLDALTEAVVEGKVKQFAYTIARRAG